MGGGMSFPLLHYCSVYLVSTLNHCGLTQLEEHLHTNICMPVRVQHTHTQRHVLGHVVITFEDIPSSNISPSIVVTKLRKVRFRKHINTHFLILSPYLIHMQSDFFLVECAFLSLNQSNRGCLLFNCGMSYTYIFTVKEEQATPEINEDRGREAFFKSDSR